MRFYVTKNDIKRGHPFTCALCPVALSIQRRLSLSVHQVSVGILTASIKRKVFQLPSIARNFIAAFDRGQPVSPFTFTLPIKNAKSS
jgi:hypothetical protein